MRVKTAPVTTFTGIKPTMQIREVTTRLVTQETALRTAATSLYHVLTLIDAIDIRDDTQENLAALYFDVRLRLIAVEKLFRGTLNACTVSPRDVAKSALLLGAAAVVLTHNHPSGDPLPSAEDVNFTRSISRALELLNIDVIEHVIVAPNNKHCSFKERGML